MGRTGQVWKGTGSSEEGETSQWHRKALPGQWFPVLEQLLMVPAWFGLKASLPHPYSHPQAHLEQG